MTLPSSTSLLVKTIPFITGASFIAMAVLIEVGRRIGQQRAAKDTEGARAGLGAIEGAVFALMGLLIDITTTRTMAAQFHPPMIIFVMLFLLALVSALLAGYAMAGGKSRSWIHLIGFSAIMAITVYVILDIEFPRLGLIRVDAIDQVLVDLRQSMN